MTSGAVDIIRLLPPTTKLACDTFAVMALVFGEPQPQPDEEYVAELLAREDFWSYAALADNVPVGGLTAHLLPLTRVRASELFVYDVAVREDWQRHGVGSALIERLLADGGAAGVEEMWVPADNDDVHALDFYRRTGGTAEPVTIFTYSTRPR